MSDSKSKTIAGKGAASTAFESKYCLPKHPPGMMLEFLGPYLCEHAGRLTPTNHQNLKTLVENEWSDYAASGKVRATRKKGSDDESGVSASSASSAATGAPMTSGTAGPSSTSADTTGASGSVPGGPSPKPEHVIILHQKIGMLRSLIQSRVTDPEVRNELIKCVSTLV